MQGKAVEVLKLDSVSKKEKPLTRNKPYQPKDIYNSQSEM
jgi:hypothetical protein